MFKSLLYKFIKPRNERILAAYQPIIAEINALEPKFEQMSDDDLRGMTETFRKRLTDNAVARSKERLQTDTRGLRKKLEDIFGEEEENDFLAVSVNKYHNKVLMRILTTLEDNITEKIRELKELGQFEDIEPLLLREGVEEYLRETLHEEMENSMNEILPEAFAVVREASKRTLKMRHFDVQLLGGIALHEGKIAEMKTGEGKTLVATLPVYLNALIGRGVHVVTVNDYLAKRDQEWMGQIYTFLGLTVGVIQNGMPPNERQHAYNCDITYGTNNEFGFDYLRDNLKSDPQERVQRELNYVIVDEVDSILIDEARTPLIISGEVEHDTNKFVDFRAPVRQLVDQQRSKLSSLFRKVQQYDQSDDSEAYEKYELLLKIERGNPKYDQLLEYISENKAAKKKMLQVENDYMRDKRAHELSEDLLFAISEKEHNVELTEEGQRMLSRQDPDLFVLPDLDEEFSRIDSNPDLSEYDKSQAKREVTRLYDERHEKIHNITQLIKAYNLFKKDVDYVVMNGEVTIVDEFTGRMMPGRRYSDGLHQALEAKEGVQVAKASQTIASVTLQNYFRLYGKLAGMTGTAETEAAEFMDIYKLDVVVVPTNEPMIRQDHSDVIYKTEKAKFRAAVREIAECYVKGQPVLVGTITIKVSEQLSTMLSKNLKSILPPETVEQLRQVNEQRGHKNKNAIPHSVLNAKYHEKEAEIVATAGQMGNVTIATNMAGRGTDIVLGPEVPSLGGLHIIGTERHESRRIDNQLRGRSGRQGDPGSSRFYLSLEDDLMRIFGSERVANIMERLGVDEDEPIEHGLISRTIENAQKKVEGYNFEIRKQLLKYDDVNNKQREVIYTRRDHIIYSNDLERDFLSMADDVIYGLIEQYAAAEYPEDWDWEGLKAELLDHFGVYHSFEGIQRETFTHDELTELLRKRFELAFQEKKVDVENIPDEPFTVFFGPVREGDTKVNVFLRSIMLKVIDRKWMDNLLALDHLKEGIGLRGYGQKDPLIEYKREGYAIFADMIERINTESVELIMKISVRPRQAQRRTVVVSANEESTDSQGMAMRRAQAMRQAPGEVDNMATNSSEGEVKRQPVVRRTPKVGRNDPCPCGSGKKYKKCCGR